MNGKGSEALSALRRAIQSINALVSKGDPGDRLPAIAVLARQAGVSYVTMWRAVQEFSRHGTIATAAGAPTRILSSRILPLPTEEPARDAPAMLPKWMQVFEQLNRMFVEEGLPHGGALPSTKELAGRHGVSRPTVLKAMRAMGREGWVVAHGRGYRMKRATLHQGLATLVLFTRALKEGTLLTEKANDGLRILQDECARRGILVRNRQYVQDGASLVPLGGTTYPRFAATEGQAILGFMVWTMGLEALDLDRLLDGLHRTGRPVVVLDESGEYLERPGRSRLPRLRCFSLSYPPTAGRAMGRYLLQSGHREVAYVMRQPPGRWSDSRLRGLREIFDRTGDPHAVHVVPYDAPDHAVDFEANFRAIRSVSATRRVNADHLQAFMNAIRRLEDPLQVETNNALTGVRVAQACRAAQGDGRITAWVGENDVVAVACLDALPPSRRKACRVVGFDDSRAAIERSLTSYNFGMDRLVRTMVAAVVVPSVVPAAKPGRPLEIEGTVVVR
jgi:DNA-binding FadR family transcriptional regulator/DNA-binding LacI/PurR family transcriptional regulator